MFEHKMERSNSSHAILEVESRKRKAKKIEIILSNFTDLKDAKLLDIGTGSGHIVNELSKKVKEAHSVDIVDERKVKSGYKFKQAKDEELPYKDEFFDIVVTNHVAEHTPDQGKHLSEVYRVLKPGGYIYLATPNKYWLKDPHYKLPFISWLPRKLSEKYLWSIQRKKWDIYPLSVFGLSKLFRDAEMYNALPILAKSSNDKIKDTMGSMAKLAGGLPDSVLEASKYFSPTLIFVIHKPKF